MNLSDLLKGFTYELTKDTDPDIRSLQIDNRKDLKNSLFICIRGVSFDSHSLVEDVISKGAAAILCEWDFDTSPYSVPFIKVHNTRSAMAYLSAAFYGNPAESVELVGITGTNGKTSIAHFIHEILNENNRLTGLIGTTGNLAGYRKLDLKILTSTTPDPIELHQIFKGMKQAGCTEVIMETTSHSLGLSKLDGLKFKVGVFSNLTQDHLDYHKTMEDYLEAKLKLFDKSETGIINIDSSVSDKVAARCTGKVKTYGIDRQCDYKAENIIYDFQSVQYDLIMEGKKEHIYIPIPGRFTVYNSLAALAACLELGLTVQQVKDALMNLRGVPGRMQMIRNNLGINVIIDYSHTPDGLKNIMESVRYFTKGRLITVAGCGGNRDRLKRPVMGKMVYDMSDVGIFTSDNPRDEDPDHIIFEMVQSIASDMLLEQDIAKRDSKKFKIVVNRREAIEYAVRMARKGDSVIIAGKGHEDYQEVKGKVKLYFDDAVEADNIIKELENERV